MNVQQLEIVNDIIKIIHHLSLPCEIQQFVDLSLRNYGKFLLPEEIKSIRAEICMIDNRVD